MLNGVAGLLIEPLNFTEIDKKFVKALKNRYPEEILLLSERRGNQVAFQWMKVSLSPSGVMAFIKICEHFKDYLAIYSYKQEIMTTLPEGLKKIISLKDNVSEHELLEIIQEVIENDEG